MRFSRKAAGLVAVGGVAALGIGLIGASGIGAAFTSNAKATAKIDVGSFDCTLSSSDGSVSISDNGHKATVNLGTITSSTAGSRTAPLTVTNSGSIAAQVSWSTSTTGNIAGTGNIVPVSAPAARVLGASDTQDLSIGFQWSELDNADLKRTGSAIYSVSCDEVPGGFQKTADQGAAAEWTEDGLLYTIPEGSTSGASADLVSHAFDGETLPTDSPSYLVTNVDLGTPRLVIFFEDGSYLAGRSVAHANGVTYGISDWIWPHHPAGEPASFASWSEVTANTTLMAEKITGIHLITDVSGSIRSGGVVQSTGTNTVSCFQYAGVGFGTGC